MIRLFDLHTLNFSCAYLLTMVLLKGCLELEEELSKAL